MTTQRGDLIADPPGTVTHRNALVRRDATSIPDVWRHYDLDGGRRERVPETSAAEVVPA